MLRTLSGVGLAAAMGICSLGVTDSLFSQSAVETAPVETEPVGETRNVPESFDEDVSFVRPGSERRIPAFEPETTTLDSPSNTVPDITRTSDDSAVRILPRSAGSAAGRTAKATGADGKPIVAPKVPAPPEIDLPLSTVPVRRPERAVDLFSIDDVAAPSTETAIPKPSATGTAPALPSGIITRPSGSPAPKLAPEAGSSGPAIVTPGGSASPETTVPAETIPSVQPPTSAPTPTPSPAATIPNEAAPAIIPVPMPDGTGIVSPSGSRVLPRPEKKSVVPTDLLIYQRAALQARERVARLEARKWEGVSMQRPQIPSFLLYADLNPGNTYFGYSSAPRWYTHGVR